jgi:hypothetical protein
MSEPLFDIHAGWVRKLESLTAGYAVRWLTSRSLG